ncbi:MAG: M24 family metallopeptidase [Desulfovibrionaceae bacterium]
MKEIYARRRRDLAEWLCANGLPALLVSHPANRFYLSGFELHDPQCNESSGYLVVTPEAEAYLFTDPRYQEAAFEAMGEDNVCIYRADRYRAIAAFLESKGVASAAFEARSIPYFTWKQLSAYLRLEPSSGAVERLRVVKDDQELFRMRASCRINHEVFAELERRLPEMVGLTERRAAWEIEKMFRNRGASELAFTPIVGVGVNGAKPHAELSDEKIREGDTLLVDIGGRYQDYCSDQTRTFWVGGAPSARFTETLELVQEAQRRGVEKVGPGVPVREVHRAAHDVFAKRGAAEMFTHGLGHGVGLETHEAPSVNFSSADVLQPGMILTVEPGLYDPQWSGVRWEHMVCVTEDGAEVL